MIYLMNYLEELIDIIDEEEILEFYYTDELNTFDEAEFEIPADYRLDLWKDVKYFGFFHEDDFKICRVVESKLEDVRYIKGVDKAESDLRGITVIEDKRPQNVTADQALRVALENTEYAIGHAEGLTDVRSTNFYYISPREALVKIIETWNCEFRTRYTFVDNMIVGRYIDLYKRQGQPTGKQFVYGDDLLSVVHEESEDDIVTALIGLGKGEQKFDEDGQATGGYGRRITFEDVVWSKADGDPVDKPAGQKVLYRIDRKVPYGIAQRNIGQLRHRFGVFIDEEVEDPNVLIKRTWEELERASQPLSVFRANILSIGENTKVGDTVAIIKDELKIAYEARIQKIVFDKLDNGNSEVILGDYQTLKNADKRQTAQAIRDAVSEAIGPTNWQAIFERIEEQIQSKNAEIDEKFRLAQLEMDNAIQLAELKSEEYADNVRNDVESKIEEVTRQLTDEQAELEKRNQAELDAFRDELANFNFDEDRINEIIKGIDVTKAFDDVKAEIDKIFADVKSQIMAVSETSRVNAEMIGNDGITRYNKNLVMDGTSRKIPFEGRATVRANDGGFKRGQTYTISFEALCQMMAKVAVSLTQSHAKLIQAIFTDPNGKFPKVTHEMSSSPSSVELYPYPYSVNVKGPWYKSKTLSVNPADTTTLDLGLEYREIADGNLEAEVIGTWAEKPEIILDGGNG